MVKTMVLALGLKKMFGMGHESGNDRLRLAITKQFKLKSLIMAQIERWRQA